MKTPREVLLSQHETMRSRVDEVCRTAQASALSKNAPARAESKCANPAFLSLLWQELFWAVRWTWAAFALIWTLIVSVNLAMYEKPAVVTPDAFADWSSMLSALEQPSRPPSKGDRQLPAAPARSASTTTNA